MKRIIAIFTSSRAEFSACAALIKKIEKSDNFDYRLFVGGGHLAKEFGETINEINNLEFRITDTFDYLLNESSEFSIAKSSGICIYEIARIFNMYNFDFVCLLGDRFELLSIIQNAIIFSKPIIHISGGEVTEGVIDDQIRHMLTKASHIHFSSCEEYRNNIIKLGEQPWRVFNVGELTIDSITNCPKISKDILFHELGISDVKETVLLTFHPVTLEFGLPSLNQIKNIFSALNEFNFQVIVTAPGHENDRDIILKYINSYIESRPDYHFYYSLGFSKYYNLIPHCKFVIGNSSSGITEIPFFKVPTINIGDRQKGRIRHQSIIDTNYDVSSIKNAIIKSCSDSFILECKEIKFKFGDGHTADKILKILSGIEINEELFRKQIV